MALPKHRLPAELDLGPLVGRGGNCLVYEVELSGRPAVLKLYKPEAAAKFRRRHGLSIARYEFDRNRSFQNIKSISHYIAEPLRVLGQRDGYSEGFVQQQVEGIRLDEIMHRRGCVPTETLAMLKEIVAAATAAGLYDAHISPNNVIVRETSRGWTPMLFDFNLMPQHLRAPNPLVALLYRIGWRQPAHRDRLMLKHLAQWRK